MYLVAHGALGHDTVFSWIVVDGGLESLTRTQPGSASVPSVEIWVSTLHLNGR